MYRCVFGVYHALIAFSHMLDLYFSTMRCFVQLVVQDTTACGLLWDGKAMCVGPGFEPYYLWQTDSPFISLGLHHSVLFGVQTNGSLAWLPSRTTDLVDVPPVSAPWQFIACGGKHVCGLLRSGQVVCWGDNEVNQTAIPAEIPPAIALSVGWRHSCLITTTKRVVCWGDNSHGQLNSPPNLFRTVSAGTLHTCGMLVNGTGVCWGYEPTSQEPLLQTLVPGDGTQFNRVYAGGDVSCGLTSDGSAYCWGWLSSLPVENQRQSGRWSTLALDVSTSCGLSRSGRPKCWGDPSILARTVFPYSSAPATDVFVGHQYTCIHLLDSSLHCWGATPLHGLADVVAVSTADEAACALLTNGTGICTFGSAVKDELPPGVFWSELSTARAYGCGVTTSGNLSCWGSTQYNTHNFPEVGMPWRSVQTAATYACGIIVNGTVKCWGSFIPPVPDPSQTFMDIKVSSNDWCGRDMNGSLYCYGYTWDMREAQGKPFISYSVSPQYACGVNDTGHVACWGFLQYPLSQRGSQRITKVAIGRETTCFAREDLTVVCISGFFSDTAGTTTIPLGYNITQKSYAWLWGSRHFASSAGLCVSRGSNAEFQCGWRSDWAPNLPNELPASSQFTLTPNAAAFLDAAGNLRLFDLESARYASLPSIPSPVLVFAVSPSGILCASATHTSTVVQCFNTSVPSNESPILSQSVGAQPVMFLTMSEQLVCGLDALRQVFCWDFQNNNTVSIPSLPLTLEQVDAGDGYACGVTTTGKLGCWGSLPQYLNQLSDPIWPTAGGRFLRVSNGPSTNMWRYLRLYC